MVSTQKKALTILNTLFQLLRQRFRPGELFSNVFGYFTIWYLLTLGAILLLVMWFVQIKSIGTNSRGIAGISHVSQMVRIWDSLKGPVDMNCSNLAERFRFLWELSFLTLKYFFYFPLRHWVFLLQRKTSYYLKLSTLAENFLCKWNSSPFI